MEQHKEAPQRGELCLNDRQRKSTTQNENGHLKTTPKAGKSGSWQVVGVCLFLALAVLAVFGQTARFGFVNYDDEAYVSDNAQVTSGLSLRGAAWDFTHVACSLYHPLTMISLRLDYQLHKLDAGGYHLTNVLIHAATAILLFLILRRMTGALWRSAFVAAVFAVHPLRAESVAWVAERKDVLSGLFFMLTIWAYARYAGEKSKRDHGSPGLHGWNTPNLNPNHNAPLSLPSVAKSRSCVLFYILALAFFTLGLLSKATVVTLPFVLLLLDYWPMRIGNRELGIGNSEAGEGRGVGRPFWGLVREKIPLLVLAALACGVTFLAAGKEVASGGRIPIGTRIGNALVSYVVYLRQTVWPSGLAACYPYPEKSQPLWEIGLALFLLAGISGVALALWRKRPWLMVGWFWYLGMLVPVIGIVQVGRFANADRNTYLPQIGLALAATWAVADWSAGWKHRQTVLGAAMLAVIGALAVCGHNQTSYWRDSQTLWTRALDCTSNNSVAHVNMGFDLFQKGKLEEAIAHYIKALEITPDSAAARINLGNALVKRGQPEEAIAQYRKVLETHPDDEDALYNLGLALFKDNDLEQAITQYRKALEIKPDDQAARNSLGNALADHGQLEDAVAQYRRTLEINPRSADACADLGVALAQKGQTQEAAVFWQKALDIAPDRADVQINLAWLLATTSDASLRDGARAVALAARADQLSGGADALAARALAAACAETGRYQEAAATARRALDLAVAQKNDALAAALQKEIKRYEAGAPFRDGTTEGSAPTGRVVPQ